MVEDKIHFIYKNLSTGGKSELPGGASSEECINPCKIVPYQPETESEKEAIASWQGVMQAMAQNDVDAYSLLAKEQFTTTDNYHERPYSKAVWLTQISKQQESG